MTNPNERKDRDGELVAVVTPVDPLRSAFALAIRALMEALPPGMSRDIALTELIAAHERAEHALARRRILN